jgi:hypothetical protein
MIRAGEVYSLYIFNLHYLRSRRWLTLGKTLKSFKPKLSLKSLVARYIKKYKVNYSYKVLKLVKICFLRITLIKELLINL